MNHLRPYDTWTYRLLFASFFLPMHVQTWLLLGLSVYWIATFRGWNLGFTLSEKVLIALMAGSFALYVVYIPLTDVLFRSELYKMIERKVSLILLPIAIWLISRRTDKDPVAELPWFVFANVVAGLVSNFVVFGQYVMEHQLSLVHHVLYRMDFEQVSGVHPSYFGLYCCWSLCLLHFHPMPVSHRLNQFLQAMLVLFLLLLAPKTAMLSALLIYVWSAFRRWPSVPRRRRLWFVAAGSGVGVLAYGFIPSFQQRINEVLNYAGWRQLGGGTSNSMKYRHLIFDIDLKLLKKHWLGGLGPVELQQQLDLAFWHVSQLTGIPIGTFNTHNEYLNQWLSFGLIGLLLLLFLLGFCLYTACKNRSLLYLLLMMIIALGCLTENLLSRQHGLLFFTVFIPLLHYHKALGIKSS